MVFDYVERILLILLGELRTEIRIMGLPMLVSVYAESREGPCRVVLVVESSLQCLRHRCIESPSIQQVLLA